MTRYLILAQSEFTANALNAWLELLGEEPLAKSDPCCIIWDRPTSDGARAIEAYESLVGLIEAAARGADVSVPLNATVVLVDSVCPAQLSAVAEGGNWNHLLAMLILTFPEIRWAFGHCLDQEGPIAAHHDLRSLFTSIRRDPLFDPTGLRYWVRARTNDGLEVAHNDLRLPVREKEAAALDEEKPYAYLHGYTAYRFGCRTDVITTWASMKERFDGPTATLDENRIESDAHTYWLLFEDMSLNFPDREKHLRLLRLEERAKQCSKLRLDNETSEHRILVTTGQTRPGDTALAENRSFLRMKSNGRGKVVFKPASGIFDLWAQAGLFRRWSANGRKGDAPNFFWLVAPPQLANGAVGHGAPGKLMLIAENLLRRAEVLANSARTVPEAVTGAVLAVNALELTGGRTPTTAIHALTLIHRLEMMAECQFSGVEYHIWMKPRLKEIAEATTAICRWFHVGQRRRAALNAEMHVLHHLVRVLRDFNRFDEEQVCMNRIRRLHNALWIRQRPFRNIFWPLLRYLEILLSSFPAFVTAILAWVFLLSLLFWWAGHPSWEYGFSDAMTSFFSIGGPIHPDDGAAAGTAGWRHVGVTGLAILSGFIHLGVFISHLYTISMRR